MIQAQKGLTLIELVIVIAILGILGTISYNAFERHQTKAKRSEGVSALLQAAQQLQQCHTDEGGYIDTSGNDCDHLTSSDNGRYNVASNLSTNSYTLTATPTFTDAECATLTITHLGKKGFSGSGSLNRCWSQ